ncbi:MAG TPA: hypothetical protein VFC06_07200, partial [Demequina sp.]|nr:hypothetical protein [Demequina sp.]
RVVFNSAQTAARCAEWRHHTMLPVVSTQGRADPGEQSTAVHTRSVDGAAQTAGGIAKGRRFSAKRAVVEDLRRSST